MSDYFLAHLNVVRPVGPFSAQMPDAQYFFQQLQLVFEAAKTSEGLMWHNHGVRSSEGSYLGFPQLLGLETDGTDNPYVMTMAGWEDAKALHRFTYRLDLHVEGMKKLRHWVDRSEGATMAMWWAKRGSRVTLKDGWDRLQMLRRDGPTPAAFNMQNRFDVSDAA